jgi:hypothetical protein
MKTFSEWCSVNKLDEGFVPDPAFQQAKRWEDLEALFEKYKNSWVQFKDETGQVNIGQLIDLLGEGEFIVRTKDGGEHDVPPSWIVAASGGRDVEADRNKRYDRITNRPLSPENLASRMKRNTFRRW